MWFKGAVLVAVIALTGQGLATNSADGNPNGVDPYRVDVKPSKLDSRSDGNNTASTPVIPTVTNGLFGRMTSCFNLGLEIFHHVMRKVSLFVQTQVARMTVFYEVLKCFITKDIDGLEYCGALAFAKYKVDVNILGRSTNITEQKVTRGLQNLNVCFKECKSTILKKYIG